MNLKHWSVYFALLMGTCASSYAETLTLRKDPETGAIRVFREGGDVAIMTQNAAPGFRPYIHPILSPDGKGVLTELSPSHHVHQTGVYWGFTRANGRDYFGNPGGGYWRRVSCLPLISKGDAVQWETVYQMLDEAGGVVMIETQRWTLRDTGDRYFLELQWTGEAVTDVTIGNYFYGGLFVRMPWHEGIEGTAVNSIGQSNKAAIANVRSGSTWRWPSKGATTGGISLSSHIPKTTISPSLGASTKIRVSDPVARNWAVGRSTRAKRTPTSIN